MHLRSTFLICVAFLSCGCPSSDDIPPEPDSESDSQSASGDSSEASLNLKSADGKPEFASHAATPQAAFDALAKAVSENDGSAVAVCLTEDIQEMFAGQVAVSVAITAQVKDSQGKAAALLTENDIVAEDVVKMIQTSKPQESEANYRLLGAKVKDKVDFLGRAIALVPKNPFSSAVEIAIPQTSVFKMMKEERELSRLSINGDAAKGFAPLTTGGWIPFEFRRVDDRWLVETWTRGVPTQELPAE